MQEEVENKSIALTINTAKLTGRVLLAAARKFLEQQKSAKAKNTVSKDVVPKGKMTVKQLTAQGQGVSSFDLNDDRLARFDRIAKKYGVNYAVKNTGTAEHPQHTIFFKPKDGDTLTAVFKEFTQKVVMKKPSVVKRLRQMNAHRQREPQNKQKQRGQER